jgi:hypothetical protein
MRNLAVVLFLVSSCHYTSEQDNETTIVFESVVLSHSDGSLELTEGAMEYFVKYWRVPDR